MGFRFWSEYKEDKIVYYMERDNKIKHLAFVGVYVEKHESFAFEEQAFKMLNDTFKFEVNE